MNRDELMNLARKAHRVPIGADLVLHEHADAAQIRLDGPRLGAVTVDAARRYATPLAIPIMDLTREKEALLELLNISNPGEEYHFAELPGAENIAHFEKSLAGSRLTRSLQANVDAVAHVAAQPDLIPTGMCIGPFSLLTKLLNDPITPVFLSGTESTVEDQPEIRLLETLLGLTTRLVCRVIEQQIDAGARVIVLAEPAANKVFFSPAQMQAGSDAFDRYVIGPNQKVRKLLKDANVELFFHCCGELIDPMLKAFTTLDPAILSLGSSRVLWNDARLVPDSTILYGNLPSKQFYSDSLVSAEDVTRRSHELAGRMKEAKHPFILGSECDVLSVPGCECTIKAKVAAMLVE